MDALRRFDPTLSESEASSGALGNQGYEKMKARMASVEADFETKTGHAWRTKEVGAPDAPETYDYYTSSLDKFQGGIKLYLDHRHVLPIDPTEGDVIEVRTGIDDWRDITNQQGDLYRLNGRKGVLRLTGAYRFMGSPYRRAIMDDNIRIRYRYGGLGGSRERGGQTELSSSITDTASSASVENAARLPREAPVLLGGDEWTLARADRANDTLELLSRGADGTSASAHSGGTKVNYCPQTIREAVAAKTAVELANSDDHFDRLVESGDNVDLNSKMDEWNREYEEALGRFSGTVVV